MSDIKEITSVLEGIFNVYDNGCGNHQELKALRGAIQELSKQSDDSKMFDSSVESLAEYAHEAWSGWMRYLFDKSDIKCGELIIPRWAVERWSRQMATPYKELPDSEKESDREEALKMILIIKQAMNKKP